MAHCCACQPIHPLSWHGMRMLQDGNVVLIHYVPGNDEGLLVHGPFRPYRAALSVPQVRIAQCNPRAIDVCWHICDEVTVMEVKSHTQ